MDELAGQQVGNVKVDPTHEMDSRPIGWLNAWWLAVVQPTTANYKRLIANPNATAGRAYLWVFGVGISAYICITPVMLAMVSRAMIGVGLMTDSEALAQSAAFAGQNGLLLCLSPIGFLMEFVICHAGALMLGGKGEYRRFIYLVAAITAPLTLVGAFLSPIPVVGLINLLLSLYAMALSAQAIQVAYQVSWIKAIAARLSGLIIVALMTICMLTLLGPAVEKTYTGTMQEIISTSEP